MNTTTVRTDQEFFFDPQRCIGCHACEMACAECETNGQTSMIHVDYVDRFLTTQTSVLVCMHCEDPACVEACPTQAITESKMFEFSFTNRADAIYTKAELVVDDDGFPQRLPWEDWREGEAEMTGGWMRATSPAGDASFEGVVQWSADLGFGVRAAEAGQSEHRDDQATGSKQLRSSFSRHLQPEDVPLDQRGLAALLRTVRSKTPRRRPQGERA